MRSTFVCNLGHVVIKPKSTMRVNPITIKFLGAIYISAKDKEIIPLFQKCKTLAINENRKSTNLEAKPYSFPFEFLVPDNLPSAMDFGKKKIARIGYKLIAILNRPMMPESLCPKFEYPVLVLEHIDVTKSPFVNAIEKQKEAVTVRNGKCHIKLSGPRSGYTRGETIPVNVVVSTSQKFVKKDSLVIDLIRRVTIRTSKNNLDEEHVLKSNNFDLNIIGPYNFSQSITSEVLIRTTPPTIQFKDKVLCIQYKVRASVYTDSDSSKKRTPLCAIELPITIGTWPRADIPIDDDDDDDIIQTMGELMLADESDDEEQEVFNSSQHSSADIRRSGSNESMESWISSKQSSPQQQQHVSDRRSIILNSPISPNTSNNNSGYYLNRSTSSPDLIAQQQQQQQQQQQNRTRVIDPTIRLSYYESVNNNNINHRSTRSIHTIQHMPTNSVTNNFKPQQHRRLGSDENYYHTNNNNGTYLMRPTSENVPNHTLTFLSSVTPPPQRVVVQDELPNGLESDFDDDNDDEDDDDLFAIIEKKKKREEKEAKRRQQRMI
ncbi:MAG: hypothetical protein EXX96DRAFT_49435 [Benjaminiella poitrasii]|nr:MAG: hypothetical protein EXX96DRAFT_49435 [Benjaminiella poitrasii]